ncbi:MAG: Universal stress protein UspA [Myxococcaceae bacterium]|nr:Universal stress protein UspA [Myxococcaceae bacterium]
MGEAIQDKFRVVVGVDFADSAKHAILEGMQLARLMPRVELHFVHVMEVSSELHDARLIDALSDSLGQGMARLERYVRDTLFVFGHEAGWGIDLGYHVRVGPVARELHQVAVDVDAELLVIGERRGGALRKIFHRSACEELVRAAHLPVVVAHPKDYKGFSKSPTPDLPRPGQDLSKSTLYEAGASFEPSRTTHIAGLL